MFLLVTLIHVVFAFIFYVFHRYIEMSLVLTLWMIFVTKVIPPLDIFKSPKFIREKTSENDTMKQSLHLSTGILFYTALIGLSLGIANFVGVPVNLKLLYYSVLFLSCVIFGIYLLFYPRVMSVFVIFRTHVLIASSLLALITLVSLSFNILALDSLLFVDLFLLFIGLLLVIVFDREIHIGMHIISIYVFLFTSLVSAVGLIEYFGGSLALQMVVLVGIIMIFYSLARRVLGQVYQASHVPLISWHASNGLVGTSWGAFFYFFWAVFWGFEVDGMTHVLGIFLLFGFWLWVYISEHKNPLFFSGAVAAMSTLCGYAIFMVLPPIFWVSTIALFVYAGILIIGSRWFRNTSEELILAGGAVVFLCGADLVMIFQDYGLFALSMLFFFQSFLWYGAYESFYRQSELKNTPPKPPLEHV